MPSQQQVRWAQLRVGLTVVFASVTLAVLIFLMGGAAGIFSRNLYLRAYFDNAQGLRLGAPVRLQGVDVGNVSGMRVVSDPKRKRAPVEIVLKVNSSFRPSLHKDSTATIGTEGVIGGSYIDLDSSQATKPLVENNDELPTKETPALEDVVRASQSTLQNVETLVKRADRIMGAIERGEGTIGMLINDPDLYNRLNRTLSDVQRMVADISAGKGSVGKLIASDEMYNKLNGAVDKLNKIVDDINAGQGSAGKFIKDPALYNNANATIAKANALMADINAGKGALGKMAKDEEFARKLDNTMHKVSNLMDRLEAGQGTLGRLAQDPSLYNNADQMLVETRNLVKAVRENPKKYLTIHFKIF